MGQHYYKREGMKLVFGAIDAKGEFIPSVPPESFDLSAPRNYSIHYPILPDNDREPIVEIHTDAKGRTIKDIYDPVTREQTSIIINGKP